MQIFVSGLWHLGCVTAACLAEHYSVIAHDTDSSVVEDLGNGRPPLYEPGLEALLARGRSEGRLTFTNDDGLAADADVVWITHDTPVDASDVGDVDFVARSIERLLPRMRPGTLVVISSQVPVGFAARMERSAAACNAEVSFAYLPENLRLGQALEIFRRPDRIVAGVRTERDRERVRALVVPFSTDVVWMTPESAEMTKHALNAFLATSVTFINEVAGICEAVGADVKDVERGLKSESRIGPRAYLAAGSGMAGGTLARDVRALSAAGVAAGTPINVLAGVLTTNDQQQRWVDRTLVRELGSLRGTHVAVLGLTYKPGTDTLRRSTAVELCRRLHDAGATVIAQDPVVTELEPSLAEFIRLVPRPADAIAGADALVVGTEWPQFLELAPVDLAAMKRRIVVDPKRWLEERFSADPTIRYFGVGKAAPQTP